MKCLNTINKFNKTDINKYINTKPLTVGSAIVQ
jgi:hypothetical protein